MLNQMWDVVSELAAWPGVRIITAQYGLSITLRGVMLGRLHWNGTLDLPFGPEVPEQLLAEMMTTSDPDNHGERRVVFSIRSPADIDHAVWLLRLAFLISELKSNAVAARPASQAADHS